MRRDGNANGVEDREEINNLLRDRASDRRQIAGGGDDHAENAQRHASDGTL